MRVSDKSPCAREAGVATSWRVHANKRKHAPIYLYLARARRFVRTGQRLSPNKPLLMPNGQPAIGNADIFGPVQLVLEFPRRSQDRFPLTGLTQAVSEVSDNPTHVAMVQPPQS